MADSESLVLFIDNTQALHKQMRIIERALMEKIVRGKYDKAKAPKAFAYLTEAAAKQYVREFGESEELPKSWHLAFPKRVRDETDKDLAARFWERMQFDQNYVAELAHARDVRKHRTSPIGRSQSTLIKARLNHR